MQGCLFYNSKKAVSFPVVQLLNEKIPPPAVNPAMRGSVSASFTASGWFSQRDAPQKDNVFAKLKRCIPYDRLWQVAHYPQQNWHLKFGTLGIGLRQPCKKHL